MNEDTKDCTRLPVVAWLDEGPDQADATAIRRVMMDWINCGYTFHPLCRLTDAQALLAQKDARIAELERLRGHGTTGDKYRAELYDEVWQKSRDMGFGNVTEALAQLEQLQAAPAERELALLREYRLSAIAYNNSHGVETDTLEEAVEIEREAEVRVEVAEKACWEFYRLNPSTATTSESGE